MRKNFVFICSFLMVLALFFTGCEKEAFEENKKMTIVTSFYPLEFITKEIVKDKADVINLAQAVSIHSYTPSPKDLVLINEGDLLVLMGNGLEKWSENAINQRVKEDKKYLIASMGIELYSSEGVDKDSFDSHSKDEEIENDLITFEEPKHEKGSHEHEDEHEHEHEHEHDHGSFDPHIWLDPELAKVIALNIKNSLIDLDSKNAEYYTYNYDDLVANLTNLSEEYLKNLENCSKKSIIISHDAFGYIARKYNFSVLSISGISDMDKPSAKILKELIDISAKENLNYILVENNNIKDFAETISTETGIETLLINPMGKGTGDKSKNYFDVSKDNINSLKTALECK